MNICMCDIFFPKAVCICIVSLGGYPPFNTECSTMSVREQIINGHYRFIPSQWKKVSNEGNFFALHWKLDTLIACRYQFILSEIFELKSIQCKLYFHFVFQPKIWSRSSWLWIPKSVWASKRRWHIRGWMYVHYWALFNYMLLTFKYHLKCDRFK